MDLWIRSQDRQSLVVCKKLYIQKFYDGDTENKAREAYGSAISKAYNFGSSKAAELEGNKRRQCVYELAKEYYSINCEDGRLGTYDTEARALEILNEVQTILNPQTLITLNSLNPEKLETQIECTNFNTTHIENAEIKPLQQSSVVYEMPEV